MRLSIIVPLMLWAGAVEGAVVHVPLKSNLVLNPDEAYTLTVQASDVTEIGWQAVQAKACTTNCVKATDLTSDYHYSMATALGASKKYTPAAGSISIEYRNVSGQPVTINIFRIQRTCDAEACKFIDARQKGRWLVFKIDEFKSITTSQDASYSIITGVTTTGRPFSFKAVWWTDDKTRIGVNCTPFVKKVVDTHMPREQYRPYVISGRAIGEPSDIVLESIDTCAAKAPNYGAPDENVFK